MRDACVNAVNAAMRQARGRDLNSAEIKDIETRVSRWMRQLAQQNPKQWAARPEAERLTEAGKAAAQEIIAEAKRRKENLETRVLRMAALTDFVDRQIAAGRDTYRMDAIERVLAPKADLGGSPEGGSLDERAQGIYSDAVSALADVFEAGKRRGIWRIIPFNEPGTNALLRRALAGVTDGVPKEFQRLAQLAHDHIELMRERFNAAGGAIGRLEDWGEPHHWSDQRLIQYAKRLGNGDLNAGRALIAREFADGAVRRRYVREDGAPMSTDEIRAFMDNALITIMTDGANKRLAGEEPGFAQSVAANRFRAHREIHIRPDAVEGLLNKYSELGAMESLLMHMRALARDVALIETFGPNADLTAKQMMEKAYAEDVVNFPDQKKHLTTKRDHSEYIYDYLAGHAQGRRNLLSTASAVMRSYATFKSLGFTVWSSLTDPVIMQHVAWARGLNQGKLWLNDVAMFMGSGRRWAKRAGLLTDTVAGYADRFAYDHLTAHDLAAKAASFTLKATGLNWVTEARRGAYGLTMMDAIGHLVRYNENLGALKSEDDAKILRLLNIDDDTWGVWRAAKLETLGANHTVLSPQAIYAIPDAELNGVIERRAEAIRAVAEDRVAAIMRMPDGVMNAEAKARAVYSRRQMAEDAIARMSPALIRNNAVTQLLGIVKDETNTAVITAGSRERGIMLGDQTKSGAGTIGGELRRNLVLFRSYPWTFMTRQWELAKSIDSGVNRAAYAASLIVTTTMVGIMINWIYDLLNGRDPGAIDPTSSEGRRNIIAGVARGGGAGIFQDFLFANADQSGRSQSLTSTLTGPVPSQLDAVQQLTLGNLNQAAAGQDPHFGPEAARFAASQFPNFFYTRAITDRYIFQALQEEMEPGYNTRMARAQFQTRGTSYFWEPGTPAPQRAPDMTRALEADMPTPHHHTRH